MQARRSKTNDHTGSHAADAAEDGTERDRNNNKKRGADQTQEAAAVEDPKRKKPSSSAESHLQARRKSCLKLEQIDS